MNEVQAVSVDKKIRSKSYPAYGLRESIELVEMIRERLGAGPYGREAIAEAIEAASPSSGAFNRKVSALMNFGLLQRSGSGYGISSLAERMIVPLSDGERSEAVRQAFYNCSLYTDILEAFSTEGRLPRLLENTLVRRFGIQSAASKSAAATFRASGEFAGVLSADGAILPGADGLAADIGEEDGSDAQREEETICPSVPRAELGLLSARPSVPLGSAQSFTLALGRNRFAVLTTPCDLTNRDVRLIQKQVEVLALQAEIGVDENGEENAEN